MKEGVGLGGWNKDGRQSREEGAEEMKGEVWRLEEEGMEGESGRGDVKGWKEELRRGEGVRIDGAVEWDMG